MHSVAVVMIKVLRKSIKQDYAGFRSAQVNVLVFDTTPKSFHENVVQCPSFTIHTDSYISIIQYFGKCVSYKFATLVSIEYLRMSMLLQRLFEQFPAKTAIVGIGYAPCNKYMNNAKRYFLTLYNKITRAYKYY